MNVSFTELREWYGRALAGLHTMWNEHFGIGVVEMMVCHRLLPPPPLHGSHWLSSAGVQAAGVITVAHDSGGPRADIVQPGTGYLATTPSQYADALQEALTTGNSAAGVKMRQRARAATARFSQEAFCEAFVRHLLPLLL